MAHGWNITHITVRETAAAAMPYASSITGVADVCRQRRHHRRQKNGGQKWGERGMKMEGRGRRMGKRG
jgi:hypothetical protein